MGRVIVLDAGPLGAVSKPRGKPESDRARARLAELETLGAVIVIPAITDYEVRRELIRVGATAGLRRLDVLKSRYLHLPITDESLLIAARLWADVRNQGRPAAGPQDLDADAILAAQVLDRMRRVGGDVTVVTGNVRHLSRFSGIDAREWWGIY